MTRLFGFLIVLFGCNTLMADPDERTPANSVSVAPSPRVVIPPTPKLPLTNLLPAKPMFEACRYHYPVSTTSSECQAFLDQSLGMYYSYVWMEAARAAETALSCDPECAYAWLALHRALEKWGRGTSAPQITGLGALLGATGFSTLPDRITKSPLDYSLEMAHKLLPRANHREQLLIQSRLQERGMWPGVPPDQRRKKAAESLDELLMLYEEDEEGWFWRAQLADTGNAKAVYYKALLRVNPIHPGANHELVHYFENIRRPALGWSHAQGYMDSSPGIPHAFHMQAHLAMRIGKWGPTTDWSAKAIDLETAYHAYQGVKPSEDHQFNHHMETLTRSLIHDGRFAEAHELKTKALSYQYNFRPEWFRMALAEKDWPECQRIIDQFRRSDKSTGAYYAAILCLENGETQQAGREIDTLRQAAQSRKSDRNLERRLLEVQGWYLCQNGASTEGLRLLKKLVDETKNDYQHHAWGNGAIYMETWGIAALEAGDALVAEEAFQEALAHDTGSVRGALGLWALCDRLGRGDEANRYLKLANRIWAKAGTKDFESIKADMARRATKISRGTTTTVGGSN